MRDENLNPHDIGPPDEEHTEDHDSDGIASILEIFSQEKLNILATDAVTILNLRSGQVGVQKLGGLRDRLFIYCTIHHRFYPVLGCAVSTVLKNEFQYGRT